MTTRYGDPSQDPPGTCRWRNPRDSGPWIKVAEDRWVHVGGGGGQDDEVVAEWPVGTLRAPAAVDWPARFRAAAEVARLSEFPGTARDFESLAEQLRSIGISWPDAVEAIRRALLGEQQP